MFFLWIFLSLLNLVARHKYLFFRDELLKKDNFGLVGSQREVIITNFKSNKLIVDFSVNPDITRQSIGAYCDLLTRDSIFQGRNQIWSFFHRHKEIVVSADVI